MRIFVIALMSLATVGMMVAAYIYYGAVGALVAGILGAGLVWETDRKGNQDE